MPARLTRPTVGRRPTIALLGGRADDRAGGLGADRDRRQAGRGGGAGAGARAARAEVEVVRVQDLAAERAVAVGHAVGHEVRELGQVRLADDHRAGRAQLGHDGRVAVGNRVLERDVARRGRQAGDVEVVLDQDGDAVHRARGACRSRARGRAATASVSALGLVVRTALSPGPRALTAAIRSMYARVSCTLVSCARGHLRLQLGHRRALQVAADGGGRRRRPREQQARQQAGHDDQPSCSTPLLSPLDEAQLNSARRALSITRVCRSLSARWG